MAEAFKGDICPACPVNSSSGSCGGNNGCGLPCKSQTLAAYLDNTGYVVNVFDLESYLESHGVHKCSHMSTVIGPTTGICKAYKMYLEKSIGSKKLRKAKGGGCLLTPQLCNSMLNAKCSSPGCNAQGENWLCLTCLKVFCGRYENKHMLDHYADSGHCVVMSLKDLNVWCYGCDAYLEHDFFPALQPFFTAMHRAKFGKQPPQLWVDSEKSQGLKRALSWNMGPAAQYSVLSKPTSAVLDEKKERQMLIPGVFEEPCPHLRSIVQRPPEKPIPFNARCMHKACRCSGKGDNWVCLTCLKVFCGRNDCKHMLQHSEDTEHEVAISLKDLSIWCYSCQNFLDHTGNPHLSHIFEYFHRLKFGESSLKPSVIPALSRQHSLADPSMESISSSDFDSSLFSWESVPGSPRKSIWEDFPAADAMESPMMSPVKPFQTNANADEDCGCGGDSTDDEFEMPNPAKKMKL